MNNLSTEQNDILTRIKTWISFNTGDLIQHIKLYDDWALLRFSQARSLDFDDTIEMLQQHVYFMRDLGWYSSLSGPFFTDFIDNQFYSQDKQGCPVIIQKWSLMNIERAISQFSPENLLKNFLKNQLNLIHVIFPICSKISSTRIDQVSLIIDLEHINISKIVSKSFIQFFKKIVETGSDNFPEILKNIYIVNPPMLFAMAVNVYKRFFPQKTFSKIIIIKDGKHDQIFQNITKEKLPCFLGGCCNELDLKSSKAYWGDYYSHCFSETNRFPGKILVSDPLEASKGIDAYFLTNGDTDIVENFEFEDNVCNKLKKKKETIFLNIQTLNNINFDTDVTEINGGHHTKDLRLNSET